ncbi:MAG: hypothetical protein JOY93_03480 [Acidobacteriales bacterium]|nr:hypothetical protein [Terriglobales bacterium]
MNLSAEFNEPQTSGDFAPRNVGPDASSTPSRGRDYPAPAALCRIAADPALTEDSALALLKRQDLTAEVFESLNKNSGVIQSRKVKLAIATHARAPRHISVPIVRSLFTFDLLHVALAPGVAADLKKAAEDVIINRLETISSGERLSLARRASGNIAGALIIDAESRVVQAALENSRLTEALVIKSIFHRRASEVAIHAICRHPQWSARREVRMALLRHQKTPLASTLKFAQSLPPKLVREILHASRLPTGIKACLLNHISGHSENWPVI